MWRKQEGVPNSLTMYLVFSDGSEVLVIYDEGTSCFVVKSESLQGINGSLDILRTEYGDIRVSSVEVVDKTRRRTFMHLYLKEEDLDSVSAGSDSSRSPCTSECSLAEDSDSIDDDSGDDSIDEYDPVDEEDGSCTSMTDDDLEEEPSEMDYSSDDAEESELTDHFGGSIDEITLMQLNQHGSWY